MHVPAIDLATVLVVLSLDVAYPILLLAVLWIVLKGLL